MRKPRKGAPQSADAPTPPVPTPSDAPQKPLRFCYWCNNKPAVQICSSIESRDNGIFCSEMCASLWACDTLHRSRMTWCITHRTWSDMKGRCLSCDLVTKGMSNALIPGAAPSVAAGQEVDHE